MYAVLDLAGYAGLAWRLQFQENDYAILRQEPVGEPAPSYKAEFPANDLLMLAVVVNIFFIRVFSWHTA